MVADEQVVTGEAVALELRTADAGSRGVAALLDLALMAAALFALTIVVAVAGSGANDATVAALLVVVFVGVLVGYPVASETLWRGRTVGKAVMGLRVVRDDGGPIRFRHALVRGLAGVVIDKPGISVGLLAFVPIVVSARHKRVGDMFAGTVVLSERVAASSDVPVAMPAPLAGWAAGLDLAGVDDPLAMRARQLLMRAGQLSPDARHRLQQSTAAEILARVGPAPAGAPDWAVLAAVVAERRRRALATSRPARPDPARRPSPPTLPAPPTPPPDRRGFAPPG